MTTIQRNQGGVMLLEAMIRILIFSLGVLALVAMQAVSISNVSNARFRSEAAFLANEILSQAWIECGADNASTNLINFKYPGGGTTVNNWVTKVQALLPQSSVYTPTITQTAVPGMPRGTQLTVTIQWKAPDALVPSNHVAIGFITESQDR